MITLGLNNENTIRKDKAATLLNIIEKYINDTSSLWAFTFFPLILRNKLKKKKFIRTPE